MRVVLFGSRAQDGSPTQASDYDVAIVLSDESSKGVTAEYLRATVPDSSVDIFPDYYPHRRRIHLLVMSESDYQNRHHPLTRSVRQGQELA